MKKIISVFICTVLVLCAASALLLSASAATPPVVRYGYSTITNDNIKYVYEELEANVTSTLPTAKIALSEAKNIKESELKTAFSLFVSDHPECFWVRTGYNYTTKGIGGNMKVTSVSPSYSPSTGISEAKAELDAAVNDIMKLCPTGTEYERALYLHDALLSRVTYEQVGEHQTAYGALVAGKAVCAGYAAAYQLLLREAGIVAWTVTGESIKPGGAANIPHAWNMALIDGKCVYIDPTWDDTDDELFHNYFCISKDEMAADHLTADIFSLPQCDHTNESYFDANPQMILSSSATVADVAALFGPNIDGYRYAVFYFEGVDFEAWINTNYRELYNELDGGAGAYGYSSVVVGNEVHLEFHGSFPKNAYKLEIELPANVITSQSTAQHITMGEAMADMLIKAKEGFYFPEEYGPYSGGGLTLVRIDAKTLKLSGTPIGSMRITVAPPTAMTPAETPDVTLEITGAGTGILHGLKVGMSYTLGRSQPIEVTVDGDVVLTDITYDRIYIVNNGNGISEGQSAIQMIAIPEAAIVTPPSDTEPPKNEGDGGAQPPKEDGEQPSKPEDEGANGSNSSNGSVDGGATGEQSGKPDGSKGESSSAKNTGLELPINLGCNMSAGATAVLVAVSLLGAAVMLRKKDE